MGKVNFITTTQSAFSQLDEKDVDTLYFIEDEHKIYKGDISFSQEAQGESTIEFCAVESGVEAINSLTRIN